MKRSTLAGAIFIAAVVAGCSERSKVEGTWIATDKSFWDGTKYLLKMDTRRNGDNYIINLHTEQYRDAAKTAGEAGKKAAWSASQPKTVSATYNEGKLVVNPFTAFTYVKADGTILGPGGEVYRRETTDELTRLKREIKESYKEKHPRVAIEP